MTHLWDKSGPENTGAVVEAVLGRARETGVKHIVVASNSGQTARGLVDKGFEVVWVTHQAGFKAPGEEETDPVIKRELLQKGVKILTTTHLLGGVGRAIRLKFGGLYPAEIVASTLRMLGQGTKVCVEIAVMALDAGLVPAGKEVMAVAGSGRGADTACLILPAHSQDFFATVVKEIVCMPREK